ncbi:MAG: FAD-dependent oxidoreductase [Clostridiales bacterium]|nr:FAD-dependent oxidoreductase [Clostridiales bacterium]
MKHFDIIIVGGGPAGLTAAVYARRAGKTVLVLERDTIGGQIASSPKVDNFPGIQSISGMELSEQLYTQAENLGADIEVEEVLEIRDGATKSVRTDYGAYTCAAVILATGMTHRSLGLPEEDTLAGISYCAVCDGAFYRGKDVAVCGGGNTAVQEAIYLSDLCRHVTLIHRRNTLRADAVLVDAVRRLPNVTLLLDTVISSLVGDEALNGLVVKNALTGAISRVDVSGLFLAVGQKPEGRLAQMLGIADETGFIPTGEGCKTSVPGIFAAGDCRAKEVRQLITACSDGAIAALAACQYCS